MTTNMPASASAANALATLGIAARDDDAGSAARDQEPCDRLAQPLGPAGHQGHLARKLLRLRCHVRLPSVAAGP